MSRSKWFLAAILVLSVAALTGSADFSRLHPFGALYSLFFVFITGTLVSMLVLKPFRYKRRRR